MQRGWCQAKTLRAMLTIELRWVGRQIHTRKCVEAISMVMRRFAIKYISEICVYPCDNLGPSAAADFYGEGG